MSFRNAVAEASSSEEEEEAETENKKCSIATPKEDKVNSTSHTDKTNSSMVIFQLGIV